MDGMPPAPVVLAYGVGVDSTALLIEKVARGERIDLVLTADTGVEKPATYAYLDVIRPWMDARGIRHEIVSYIPKRFKHWPPYYGLLEMCLTNATLPSKSLGGSSCSLKYKKTPADNFLSSWQPAIDAWKRGSKSSTSYRLRCRAARYTTCKPRIVDRRSALRVRISAQAMGLGQGYLHRPDRRRGSADSSQIGLLAVHCLQT